VVVKEERVDITEDVIFNAPTISYSPTAITEAVTEEKVVVVKEAKVAITKTLATLSAKLSVNKNLFQQSYSTNKFHPCFFHDYIFEIQVPFIHTFLHPDFIHSILSSCLIISFR